MRLRPQLPHSVKLLSNEPQALLSCRWSKSFSCVVSSHRRISSSRKRHCRPSFIAGISPHSAQKQTVRGDIPNHRATVAVERKLSCWSPLGLRMRRLQKKIEGVMTQALQVSVRIDFQNRYVMSRQHDALHSTFHIVSSYARNSSSLRSRRDREVDNLDLCLLPE